MAELNPLIKLTKDDLKYLHVHDTRDGLKRSTNLTNDVRAVLHDNGMYSDVPTIYYEYVQNVDSQKSDEANSSVEIHDLLKVGDGEGWIMHVLTSDLASFNFEQSLSSKDELAGTVFEYTAYNAETDAELSSGEITVTDVNRESEFFIGTVTLDESQTPLEGSFMVKTLDPEAAVKYVLYNLNNTESGVKVTLTEKE